MDRVLKFIEENKESDLISVVAIAKYYLPNGGYEERKIEVRRDYDRS